jgi:hypothetical protein
MPTQEDYFTFQKFSDEVAALELTTVLKKHNIDVFLENTSPNFDPTFANSSLIREYRVKLLKKDFEQARQLLLELSTTQLDDVDPNHYLFDFSDDELFELINKQDEWSAFDFLLAQKILKDRGKEVTPAAIEGARKKRIQELSSPEESQSGWIAFGYLAALCGGILAIFIGWYLRYHKKTLPDGSSVYAYNAADRRSGYKIFILGIIGSIFWFVLKFCYSKFSDYL